LAEVPETQAGEVFLVQPASTRYQGSKQKILDWIWKHISNLEFETFLDAMGGTGCVGFLAKKHGKQVFYNDILRANYYIGLALIENDSTRLSKSDVEFLLSNHSDLKYESFVYDTFRKIYYLDEENAWLDMVIGNIKKLTDAYKRAVALAALFQACIIKRPYNLFHRANLYMRTSDVDRSFGNKVTWDTPFEKHFQNFVTEYNSCVFSNSKSNKALNMDVLQIPDEESYDLVYIDPPYFSEVRGELDYHYFYHFLEGLCMYLEKGSQAWREQIDFSRKPKPLKKMKSPWTNKKTIKDAFDNVFRKFEHSILVVSYNSRGIPSEQEIVAMLRKYKSHVTVERIAYQYALSRTHPDELLFIAE